MSSQVIRSDSSRWESLLMRQAAQQGIRHSALATALQKRMEQVVLSETSGSHSQRVLPSPLFPNGHPLHHLRQQQTYTQASAGVRSRQGFDRLTPQPL